MKPAGWIAAVVTSMGLSSTSALAQQTGSGWGGHPQPPPVWRPIIRASAHSDGPPVRSGGTLPGRPGASLGAPRTPRDVIAEAQPEGRAASGTGRPDEVIAATYPMPGARPAAPGLLPEDDPGVVFAGDRGPLTVLPPPGLEGPGVVVPAVPGALPAVVPDGPPKPIGDWKTTYPLGPPPPGPPLPGTFGETIPPTRWYFSGEYLLWWAKQDRVPPLATTGSPASGTAAGTLGRPDTVVLFDGRLDRDPRSGGRFTAGWWLDDCMAHALEVSAFFLGSRSAKLDVSLPVLIRPFFDLNNNRESGEIIAFPGVSTGRLRIDAPSDLWGAEANYKCKLCCGKDWRINGFVGFRYLELDESITIREDIDLLANVNAGGGRIIPAGTHISSFDRFQTINRFYGGQVGAEGRWLFGRVTLDVKGKLALGVTDQEIRIDGQQTLFLPDGTVQSVKGGLLALPGANIGNFSRTAFAVVPEVGINVGYFLTPRVRAYVGYNFLYWSNVVRPGDQIDRGLDVTRIPNFNVPPGTPPLAGGARPAVPFRDTDFWAQGLVFGMELTW